MQLPTNGDKCSKVLLVYELKQTFTNNCKINLGDIKCPDELEKVY